MKADNERKMREKILDFHYAKRLSGVIIWNEGLASLRSEIDLQSDIDDIRVVGKQDSFTNYY